MSKQNILHTYVHKIECCQLHCTFLQSTVLIVLFLCSCNLKSVFMLVSRLNLWNIQQFLKHCFDVCLSQSKHGLYLKFHKLQFAACLAVFAVVAIIGVHVPSPAVCGCSSANHQPQARISTSKTLRTSFHMMGSLKLQLWNIRFPLRSRRWSLMHESNHFKKYTCNC